MGQGAALPGGYTLRERLGSGASSEVWKASDRSGKAVAIKIYKEGLDAAAQNEAEILSGVSHQNVNRVIELRKDGGSAFMVLDFVDAGDLSDYLCKEGMPLDDTLRLGRQICSGLIAIHARGLVHGDLKPSNVLITSDGIAKISDFGLGQKVDPDRLELSLEDVSVAGTVGYLSPERREGKAASTRDDMYSFGVILYEMLTGNKPSGLRRAAEVRDDVSPALDALVVALLDQAKDRPDAVEALAVLTEARPRLLPVRLRPIHAILGLGVFLFLLARLRVGAGFSRTGLILVLVISALVWRSMSRRARAKRPRRSKRL